MDIAERMKECDKKKQLYKTPTNPFFFYFSIMDAVSFLVSKWCFFGLLFVGPPLDPNFQMKHVLTQEDSFVDFLCYSSPLASS